MAKLTTAIATEMVKRIEALQEQIDAVYTEANGYDGTNNGSVIRDCLKSRAAAREEEFMANGYLLSFDAED